MRREVLLALMLVTPILQRQAAVTAYFSSEQLLLFIFAPQHCEAPDRFSILDVLLSYLRWHTPATPYVLIKPLLLFGFARQVGRHYQECRRVLLCIVLDFGGTILQMRTAVTAYFTSKQLLLCAFALRSFR